MASSLYGICGSKNKKRQHKFNVDAAEINLEIKVSLHGNSKVASYDLNYKFCGTIQAMGCCPTDAMILTSFLDLPTGKRMESNMKIVEKVMGPVQVNMKVKSKEEAVFEKITVTDKKLRSNMTLVG